MQAEVIDHNKVACFTRMPTRPPSLVIIKAFQWVTPFSWPRTDQSWSASWSGTDWEGCIYGGQMIQSILAASKLLSTLERHHVVGWNWLLQFITLKEGCKCKADPLKASVIRSKEGRWWQWGRNCCHSNDSTFRNKHPLADRAPALPGPYQAVWCLLRKSKNLSTVKYIGRAILFSWALAEWVAAKFLQK